MAQASGYLEQGYVLINQIRSMGMPEIMNADLRKACTFSCISFGPLNGPIGKLPYATEQEPGVVLPRNLLPLGFLLLYDFQTNRVEGNHAFRVLGLESGPFALLELPV